MLSALPSHEPFVKPLHVDDLDTWDCDSEAQAVFEELQELYRVEGEYLPGLKEDPLIDAWIDPVLETLGFSRIPEMTLPDGGATLAGCCSPLPMTDTMPRI